MSHIHDPSPETRPDRPEEIEADIARQREQLAETVGALQDKLDVKARAQDKVLQLQDRATTSEGRPRPEVLAVAGGAVLLVVVLLVRRHRRHG